MEIYYCQTCGMKVDSDAIAGGDAVRASEDIVYCRPCAAKVPGGVKSFEKHTPHEKYPSHDRHHPRVPVKVPPHPRPKSAAPPPAIAPRTFAIICLLLGGVILLLGAWTVFKKKPEPETPVEKAPEKTSENPPAVVLKPSPAPTIDLIPPATPKVDREKAEYDLYTSIMRAGETRTPNEHADALERFIKEYPSSSLLPRVRVELSRIAKVQKALADGFVTIGTFEPKEDGWGFHDGGEFPGAKGSMDFDTSTPKEGTQSLKLSGNFTGGGSYVSVGRNLAGATIGEILNAIPAAHIAGLRLWVRSPVAGAISLRANDSGEQCHQQTLSFSPKPEWQQIEFKSLNSGQRYSHWGGKDDGVWRGGLRGIALMLTSEGVGPTKEAQILIDQIELVLKK